MWTKEQLRVLAGSKRFAVAVASVMSAASGSVGGYLLAKKKLQKEYSELADREIREAKEYYTEQARKNKVGEFADPLKLAEKYEGTEADSASEKGEGWVELREEPEFVERDEELIKEVVEITRELKYHAGSEGSVVSEMETAEVKESIRHNIFDNREPIAEEDDEFDIDVEREKRAKATGPYIISEEEYFENEDSYSQTSLSWFDGDDVLTDEKDVPIRDVTPIIGVDTLKFGYGSGDANTVFIRNDRFQALYEVTRSEGEYAKEVLGFLEHSDKPQLRKFRLHE